MQPLSLSFALMF